MAYSSTNPPYLTVPAMAGGYIGGSTDCGASQWAYRSADPLATVITTGYFSDGHRRGMKPGEIVQFIRMSTAATPVPAALHTILVTSMSSNGITAAIIGSSST